MSLYLATKGIISAAALTLATKGVIYVEFAVELVTLYFRAELVDVEHIVVMSDGETIVALPTDRKVGITLVSDSDSLSMTISDGENTTTVTDRAVIATIINSNRKLIASLLDKDTRTALIDRGVISTDIRSSLVRVVSRDGARLIIEVSDE